MAPKAKVAAKAKAKSRTPSPAARTSSPAAEDRTSKRRPSATEVVLKAIREAQDGKGANYKTALAEITHGRKTSHWIWYVWPCLQAVRPGTSKPHFLLPNMDTAKAYLRDEVLAGRLEEITLVALQHLQKGAKPQTLFGSSTDAEKFSETMTIFLFAATESGDARRSELFGTALIAHSGGLLNSTVLKSLAADDDFAKYCTLREVDEVFAIRVAGELKRLEPTATSDPEALVYYFAFGSNMRRSRMDSRITADGGVFLPAKLSRLNDYRLDFSKTPGYANIHRCAGEVVYGLAYQMDTAAFRLLDGYEGCVSPHVVPEGFEPAWQGHYYRMSCSIEVLDESWTNVHAIAYKAHRDKTLSGCMPADDYLGHLLAGEELLPANHVERILELAKRPSQHEEDPPKGTCVLRAEDGSGTPPVLQLLHSSEAVE